MITADGNMRTGNEELRTLNKQLNTRNLELIEARDFVQTVLDSVTVAVVVLDAGLAVKIANKAFDELSGLRKTHVYGRLFPQLAAKLWKMIGLRPLLKEIVRPQNGRAGFELEHNEPGTKGRVLHLKARPLLRHGEKGVLVALEDITARKRADLVLKGERGRLKGEIHVKDQALGRTRDQLRAITAILLTAEDQERRRLARELHDDLSQKQALVEMDIERLEQQLPCDPAVVRDRLQALRGQVGALSNDLRRIAHQLHPSMLDDLGLPFALKAMAQEFAKRESRVVRFSARHIPESIRAEVAGCLYRITQEALHNVSKHAGAAQVNISLTGAEGALHLVVKDRGKGFDIEATRHRGGMGILSMGERVRLVQGTLAMKSRPGKGVTVSVRVPLLPEDEA